nr:hydroxymethylbilane synthase [Deltaproteobacteria bacterium]
MKSTYYIGTRGSSLALWQANHIKSQLEREHPQHTFELVKIKTSGDKILDVPLAKVGGKGLFVKEIEAALREGSIDLAVHSMKDVPAVIPSELTLAAVTRREHPGDVLIARSGASLDDLPKGARVGTSSLRRQCQLLTYRPDLTVVSLRGNLDTRLRKVETNQFDAIVVAAAGVIRMGWQDRVTQYLPTSLLLPAIGQGALGIETRIADKYTRSMVSFLHDVDTAVAVAAERAVLKRLEGGCQVPIAALGTISDESIALDGLVGSLDGSLIIRKQVEGSRDKPEELGISLAEQLLNAGGRDILAGIYGNDAAGRL